VLVAGTRVAEHADPDVEFNLQRSAVRTLPPQLGKAALNADPSGLATWDSCLEWGPVVVAPPLDLGGQFIVSSLQVVNFQQLMLDVTRH
jgi:hypothetical protein